MSKKGLRLFSILFFAIAILARGVTGAPNAQVEVFNSDFYQLKSAVAQAPTVQTAPAPGFHTFAQSKGYFENSHSISHIKSYKKYISPDKSTRIELPIIKVEVRADNSSFSFQTLTLILPTAIRTNAPPMNGTRLSLIGYYYQKGALDNEGTHTSNGDRRIGLLVSRA